MILVQKLPGKKTMFSKSLYSILNHQLLLWAGSTFFQRALDVAILWHFFLEKGFWKGLWEVACCALSLLVPSASFGAFAWRVELSTSSPGSCERFELLPFPPGSMRSSWPEGWGWPVLLCANRGREICCQPGIYTWLQMLVVLRVSQARDVPSWEVTAVSHSPVSPQRAGLSPADRDLSPGLSLTVSPPSPSGSISLPEHGSSVPSFLLCPLLGSGCVFVFSPTLTLFHSLPRIIRGLLKGCC